MELFKLVESRKGSAGANRMVDLDGVGFVTAGGFENPFEAPLEPHQSNQLTGLALRGKARKMVENPVSGVLGSPIEGAVGNLTEMGQFLLTSPPFQPLLKEIRHFLASLEIALTAFSHQ